MLGKIFKTIVDVVTAPVAVVKDVVTLGGTATGKNESYTQEKVEQLIEDLEDIA